MKSNHIIYDFEKSRKRIDEIFEAKDTSYEEVEKIPSRDKLTFNNGFYVNCWVPEEYIPMRSYAYFQAYSFMKANWKPYLRQIGHAD